MEGSGIISGILVFPKSRGIRDQGSPSNGEPDRDLENREMSIYYTQYGVRIEKTNSLSLSTYIDPCSGATHVPRYPTERYVTLNRVGVDRSPIVSGVGSCVEVAISGYVHPMGTEPLGITRRAGTWNTTLWSTIWVDGYLLPIPHLPICMAHAYHPVRGNVSTRHHGFDVVTASLR